MQYHIVAAGIIFGAGTWPNKLALIPGQPQACFSCIHGTLGLANRVIHLLGITHDLKRDGQTGANGYRRRKIQNVLINVQVGYLQRLCLIFF